MNWKPALIAAAALSLVASSAQAGARAHQAKKAQKRAKILAKFDANGNGVLDPAEKQALVAARKARKAKKRAKILAKFDANGNGVLDPAEKQALRAARKARKAKRLARWLEAKDTDRDGRLTWGEVAPDRPDRVQRARQRFDRIDANRDGAIDKHELQQAAEKLGKKRHKARLRGAPGAQPPASSAQ